MTKVYRAVPSFIDTILKYNELNSKYANMEAKLYENNIISFEPTPPFFRRNSEGALNTFSYRDEKFKGFFLFPIDAVKNPFSAIERYYYGNKEWEVLEYDIPDEILLKYCGYGFYSGDALVEFAIPESVFQNEEKIDDVVLQKKLYNILKEFANEFNSSVTFDLIEIENVIKSLRNAYSSPYITGKKIVINREELINDTRKDFITDEEMINLIEKKGIKCSSFLPLYYDLHENSDTVHWYKEDYIYELKNKLREKLPSLYIEEKKKNK